MSTFVAVSLALPFFTLAQPAHKIFRLTSPGSRFQGPHSALYKPYGPHAKYGTYPYRKGAATRALQGEMSLRRQEQDYFGGRQGVC